MPDREKVIEALECADMTDGVIKMSNQFRDIVVELLKEQEAVEPKSHPAKAWTRAKTLWFCGACGARISKRKTKFCQECGRKVRWE